MSGETIPVELGERLKAQGEPHSVRGSRSFLHGLGVLLEDIFSEPHSVPAYPESVAEACELAADLIRGGYIR